ncbi:MAG: phospholipid/cholesterol/gamma-HCH transport system substrate-binding protein [Mycobacteriales bacterium]
MRRDARAVGAPLVKLALFAVVTLAASYVLAVTISNKGYGAVSTYRAEFTDVTGLLSGDDVRIAGVRVGEIGKIRVVRHSVAEVTFSVRRDVLLPAGVLAAIRWRNLVGQRYLALTQGPGRVGATLPTGGVIPASRTTPSLDLTALFGGFQPLFQALDPTQVNQLSYEIIQVLQGEGGTVEQLLAHTASLTSTLAAKDAVIGRLVTNLNTVVGTLSTRDSQLSGAIGELRRLVSGLAADRTAIGESLTGIDGLAAATADLLVKARPAIRSDVDQLGKVAKNLNDSSSVVDGVLQRLPGKLATITRTATYGSWFNFYLCSLDGKVGLPVGTVFTPKLAVDQARCR